MGGVMQSRIYWGVTGLLAAGMIGAGIQDVRGAPELLEDITRLGYPPYFLTLIGVAKLLGAPFLLIPKWPRLKEWVYAGFAFDFIGAIVSHLAVGDGFLDTLPAIGALGTLAVSYILYRRRSDPRFVG